MCLRHKSGATLPQLGKAEYGSLKKGDREEAVLNKFGRTFGLIYAKSMWQENGSVKTYYRIYCYGLTNPEAKYYDQYSSRYIELSFTDGYLSEGTMYQRDNEDYKKIYTTSVEK